MKTVLITGANRGLGLALTKAFKDYWLILNAKSKMPVLDRTYYLVPGDLKQFYTIYQLKNKVIDLDGLDVLINNAGIYSNESIDELEGDRLNDMIETNLIAPIKLTKELWPFLKRKNGIVININSLAGKTGANKEIAYCTAKYGLTGFSESLQFEGTKDKVKVINLFIGTMKTEMSDNKDDKDKFIKIEEISNLIYNLCKDDYKSLRITEMTIKRNIY